MPVSAARRPLRGVCGLGLAPADPRIWPGHNSRTDRHADAHLSASPNRGHRPAEPVAHQWRAHDEAEGRNWLQTIRHSRPALLARWQRGRQFNARYHTKIESQKRQSDGLRSRDRYRRKLLRAFVRRLRSGAV